MWGEILFGDGWENEASLSMDVLMGGDVTWLGGNLSLSCLMSTRGGCVSPVVQHSDGRFNLSLNSLMGADYNSMISHNWEMLWSVQVVEGDVWGEIFYGGVGSEMSFLYHVDSNSYEMYHGEGLLTGGVQVPLSSESSVSGSGYTSNCVEVELEKSAAGGRSSSSSSASSFLGVGWYIMDASKEEEVVAYNSSWVDDGVVRDRICLRDGSYVLRVTGAVDVSSVNVSWTSGIVTGKQIGRAHV